LWTSSQPTSMFALGALVGTMQDTPSLSPSMGRRKLLPFICCQVVNAIVILNSQKRSLCVMNVSRTREPLMYWLDRFWSRCAFAIIFRGARGSRDQRYVCSLTRTISILKRFLSKVLIAKVAFSSPIVPILCSTSIRSSTD